MHRALAARPAPAMLVVDLRAVTFCDSSGLNALLQARLDAERQDTPVHLARPTDNVARVLEMTGVDRVLPVDQVVSAPRAAHPHRLTRRHRPPPQTRPDPSPALRAAVLGRPGRADQDFAGPVALVMLGGCPGDRRRRAHGRGRGESPVGDPLPVSVRVPCVGRRGARSVRPRPVCSPGRYCRRSGRRAPRPCASGSGPGSCPARRVSGRVLGRCGRG
ncbi:STAS domain-containing protein [Kitasatospora indigofera]|uniref:STAS domain-containing protein n=1 Tax=Kitasatospora indigofera TaxID=67307 RepID=UPI0035710572